MKYFKPIYLFILFINLGFSQSNEAKATIFNSFNTFFDNEIKRQGVKGDWIFKLNEITGLHTFDFNNDGLMDVLMEFNAVPIEGSGTINYYSVLFTNNNDSFFEFANFLPTPNLKFVKFANKLFIFNDLEKFDSATSQVNFSFLNGKFALQNKN